MPGGDRTGPMGMGPATGRGAGFCRGYGMPGYANFGGGRGWRSGRGAGFGGGFGGGFGRGWRNQYYATGIPGWARGGGIPGGYGGYYETEKTAETNAGEQTPNQNAQIEFLRTELERITRRLADLEKKEK